MPIGDADRDRLPDGFSVVFVRQAVTAVYPAKFVKERSEINEVLTAVV